MGFLQSQFGSVTLKVEVQNFPLSFSLISTITFCLYLEAFAYPCVGGRCYSFCKTPVFFSLRVLYEYDKRKQNSHQKSKVFPSSAVELAGGGCGQLVVLSFLLFFTWLVLVEPF